MANKKVFLEELGMSFMSILEDQLDTVVHVEKDNSKFIEDDVQKFNEVENIPCTSFIIGTGIRALEEGVTFLTSVENIDNKKAEEKESLAERKRRQNKKNQAAFRARKNANQYKNNKKGVKKSKIYCVTIFDLNCKVDKKAEKVEWIAWQHEKCSTTNKEHFQVVIGFKNPVCLKTVQNHFQVKCHVEVCNDLGNALHYVRKNHTRIAGPWFYGNIPIVREKPFIKLLNQLVDEKIEVAELARDWPALFVKNAYGIEKLAKIIDSKKKFKVKNIPFNKIFISGPPGCGKTSFILNKYKEKNCLSLCGTLKFLPPDIKNVDVLIIDEFDKICIDYEILLKILDNLDVYLPIKGGQTTFDIKEVVIISNIACKDLKISDMEKECLMRRIEIYDCFIEKDNSITIKMKNGKKEFIEEIYNHFDQVRKFKQKNEKKIEIDKYEYIKRFD